MKAFKIFEEYCSKTALAGVTAAYVSSLMLIVFGIIEYGSRPEHIYFIVCGAIILLCTAFVQITALFARAVPGPHSEFVTDYDRTVIGKCFSKGPKQLVFYTAICKLHDGDYNEALDDLRELKNADLSTEEKGVLGFYTSICYNSMGYPTNAGHAAAEAADNNVNIPEALLMAARSFSRAGSHAQAAESYERLLTIAEEKHIFPFIFNEMGREYLSSENPGRARYCFERALAEGLDPVTAQGGMALVCLMERKEDEACEWYRLALISRLPDTAGFREYSSQLCIAHGYPADFLDTHLREKYSTAKQEAAF